MDIIAFILFVLLIVLSVSLVYVQYQIRRMREALKEAASICEDAVKSLRNGGV
jgi:cell division protein FtsL